MIWYTRSILGLKSTKRQRTDATFYWSEVKVGIFAESFDMRNCTIHVYLLNDHFSQEYADMHNQGNESELNRRHEWEDELSISGNVDSVEMIEKGVYPLQGTYGNGDPFSIDIPNMRLFEIRSGEQLSLIACSESILSSCSIDDNNGFHITIYLKDFEPMANPIPGVYIASQEFPKDLIPDA